MINSLSYEVIIYWSKDDNVFVAEVLELPGFMAEGGTQNTALENVQEIMKQWIDTAISLGRNIPVPKGKLMYA